MIDESSIEALEAIPVMGEETLDFARSVVADAHLAEQQRVGAELERLQNIVRDDELPMHERREASERILELTRTLGSLTSIADRIDH